MKFAAMKRSLKSNNISTSTKIKAQIIHTISGKKPKRYGWLKSPKKYGYNRANNKKALSIFNLMYKLFK